MPSDDYFGNGRQARDRVHLATARCVEVIPEGGRTLWQLFAGGQSSGYASLYDLTIALKQYRHNGSTGEAKTI